MKIVHLSYHIPPVIYNNPETWLKKISASVGVFECMARYAAIEAIYHIRFEGQIRRNNVTYHFPGFNRFELLFPIRFNRYIKKLQPDVVMVHGLIFPWQVILLRMSMGSKIKIIEQHHAERPFRDFRQYIQRWADRYIGAYLFCSVEQGQEWVERKQIRDARKITEIMEASSIFFPIEKEVAKAVAKVSGEPVYLWVGRLDNNKDPLVVAKAFLQFVKEKPSAKLYMIYQTVDLLPELKELVSFNPTAIHLVGKVSNDDLQHWYNSADFIISSSHYEGSGIAVCEGLSCGCIPILTNIPSFRMMTDDGRIGLLYKVGDDRDLLNCLKRSLALERNEMKRHVVEQFQQKLSFDANAKRIMEVIHSL